ncbi:MAG: P-II family nitrogen regulator [Cupriavidus necator]
MNIKYVVAIVRSDNLKMLEVRLNSIRVGGVTVTNVKGYGEYKNLFSSDRLVEHTRVEIFAEESKVDLLVRALLDAAHSDPPGAGIVAVMPVERFLHLRTGTETLPDMPPI